METRDYAFTVPFTTMQTGLTRGGLAANIVPKECEFIFEARTLPGASEQKLFQEVKDYAATLLPEMQRIEPNAAIKLELLNTAPGMNMQETDEIVKLATALSRNKPNGAVSYGTEGGLFQAAGIPTVICGPGDIEQAHRPNEFVSLAQLAQCEAFMGRLLENEA